MFDPEFRYKTVSHTLIEKTADHLRTFAFANRFSESCIIEYALEKLFEAGHAGLEDELRAAGCGLRRTNVASKVRVKRLLGPAASAPEDASD